MIQKKQKIKYKLHYQARKDGYDLDAKNKTIFIHCSVVVKSRSVKRLVKEFGYNLQKTLL